MNWSWRRWVNLLPFPSSKYKKNKADRICKFWKENKEGKENVTLISACCMCYSNQNHLAFILWTLLPMPIPCFYFYFLSFINKIKSGNSMFSHYNEWTFIYLSLNYKKWKTLPWFISNQEREKNHRIRNKEKKRKRKAYQFALHNSNSNSKFPIPIPIPKWQ